MPVDDALSDITAALSGPAPSQSAVTALPPTGVDAALADLAKPPEQLHAELNASAMPSGKSGGLVRNFAAGGNEMAANILGAPVDVATWALNKGHDLIAGPTIANVVARETGANPQPWISNPVGGSDWIKSAMGLIGADPRSVGVNNTPESVARGVGAGAVSMAAPYMAGRAAIANGVTEGVPGAMARAFGGPAPADAGVARTALGAAENAAVGGAGAAGGQAAGAMLPADSPYRPLADMAGNLVAGGAVAGGIGAARAGIDALARAGDNLIGPMLPGRAETIAANRLALASSDPAALARSLDAEKPELVPGSRPTTFQATGDEGVGRLQASLPQAPFEARAAEQNAARVAALGNIAPGGNPGAVRDLLQQRLAAIDAAGDSSVEAAQANARQAFEEAGGRLNPADYGALMRDQLESAKASTKAQESALWQAIDPGGKLTIDARPVAQAANQIVSEVPKTALQPQGEEQAVLGLARSGGDAMPFSDFAALRGRLLQAIRDERANGQTPALRRMQQLRSAMDDAISSMSARAAQNDPALSTRLSQVTSAYYGPGNSEAAGAALGGNAGTAPPINAGAGSQAVPGFPRTTVEAAGGFGNAPGAPGVPEPRRPTDLIQFLRARGGLQPDAGGELRAMDLHQGQGFARLVRSGGMTLDDAREIAAEAGYLHPDADINDLLSALRRNQQGSPVFNESDPAAVEWRAFERARQGGAFEPVPPLPGEPATWDAAAAARYRAAADATRARAQTFNNPQIGPALQERGGAYRIAESRLPERFIASPEGVQAFLNAGGDRGTLRDALIADLRQSATNSDGTLNPTKFGTWQLRRSAALRALPEAAQALGDAGTAQQAVDAAAAQTRSERLQYQQGAARYFLNAEPLQAVQGALNGKNPIGDMRALAGMVAGDPDAQAGLQRAVANYIAQRTIRGPTENAEVGTLNAKAYGDLLARNPALAEVFTPEQMSAINGIAADLRQSSTPLPKGEAGPGSQSFLRNIVFGHGAAGLASVAGYLMGGWHGALEAFGGYEFARKAVDAMTRAGIEQRDQLLTEALLNPDVARTLLMKATRENRPLIAQRLASQLGTLAAVSAGGEAEQRQQQQPLKASANSEPSNGVALLANMRPEAVQLPMQAPTVSTPSPQSLADLIASRQMPGAAPTSTPPLAALLARGVPRAAFSP